jgi:hypothetical protein
VVARLCVVSANTRGYVLDPDAGHMQRSDSNFGDALVDYADLPRRSL